MSLLDDVSIVVTPNGYKAGELYAVIPVPTEGAEEVTNGDFATETVWTFSGVDFSVGAVLFDNDTDSISQSFADTVNTIYKLTITKTGSGTLRVRTGFAGSAATKIDIPESGIVYFTSTSDTNRIQIYGDSGSVNATLNSVSVKEWTGADMDVTRATAATRVDENGLVNYAEVVSDTELVTCGDFECAVPLDSWNVNGTATISSGKANINSPSGETAEIYQNNVLEIGKSYTLICDLDKTSGDTQFVNGGTFILANGSNNIFFTATQTRVFFKRGAGSVISSIDNVSVKEVTRDNVPRIDYTGGGCPHILAEPQSTNLLPYSEDFSNAAWQKSNITATPNSITSPDGTLNAYKLTKPTSSTPRLFELSVYPSTGVHTFTAFYKNLDGDSMLIRLDGGGNTANCTVDLTTNTLVNSGANIISSNITQLSDGWIRVSVTANILSTSWVLDAVNLFSISVGSSVYIWGAQLELGSYPTSYIPTSGSTVTRNQDIFTRDGIGSLINSTEGVLFVEMAALSDDLTYRMISLSDGTVDNSINIQYSGVSNTIRARVENGGSPQADITYTILDSKSFSKIAVLYKLNKFELWFNGSKVGEDTSGTPPLGLSKLAFDRGDGGSDFYGKVKQLQVYDTSLSDTQLAALTS